MPPHTNLENRQKMAAEVERPSGLIILATLGLLVAHAALCWRMIDGWNGIQTPYPIVRDDHTFNYYYAVTTRAYLRGSASTAGYDPNFMSGYAKSIIYPTSSTLPELVVYWFGGDHPERAFKLYVVVVAMICPVLVWGTVLTALRSHSCSHLSLLCYLAYFWSDKGAWFIVVGMVPYVLAGALAVASLAAISRFLAPRAADEQPQTRGYVRNWFWMTSLTGLAILVHLTIPVVCGPAWLVLLLSSWRTTSLRRKGALLLSIVVVIGSNLFWLAPGFVLWETKGHTDVVFVEPDVIGRFRDIAVGRSPIEGTLLLLSLVGLALRWPMARGLKLGTAITMLWCFLLAYPGGWIRALDFLQPGRYSLYLYTFATIPAGFALNRGSALLHRQLAVRHAQLASAGAWALLVGLAMFLSWPNLRAVAVASPPVLASSLPRQFEELVFSLRELTVPGERLLFEDRNKGIVENGVPVPDPFMSVRPAPLLPLMTGLELIGGPYLYNHQRTNFAQVGDGRFFGADDWSATRFRTFAETYDLNWIVCWSPEARRFCSQHPDLIEVTTIIGPQAVPLWIGKIKRSPQPALVGSATVKASPGRIEVSEAEPENGALVLRYHWTPELVCDPPRTIEPYSVAEDPVGMIRIVDPPKQFTIRLDPWQKLKSWLGSE